MKRVGHKSKLQLTRILLVLVVLGLLMGSASAASNELQGNVTCSASNLFTFQIGNVRNDGNYLTKLSGFNGQETSTATDTSTKFQSQLPNYFNSFSGLQCAYPVSNEGIGIYARTEDWGVGSQAFGGFLYVFEPISTVTLSSKVRIFSSHNVDAFSHLQLYYAWDFDHNQSLPSNQFGDIVSSTNIVSNSYIYVHDLWESEDNERTGSQTASATLTLQPGIYYLMGGISLDDRDDKDGKGEKAFWEVAFDNNWIYDVWNSNGKLKADDFAITYRLMTPSELKSNYPDYANSQTWCSEFGEYDPETGICCGYAAADFGAATSDGRICVQLDTGKGQWQSPAGWCGAVGGSFSPSLATDYTATDGSDGCCGDDFGCSEKSISCDSFSDSRSECTGAGCTYFETACTVITYNCKDYETATGACSSSAPSGCQTFTLYGSSCISGLLSTANTGVSCADLNPDECNAYADCAPSDTPLCTGTFAPDCSSSCDSLYCQSYTPSDYGYISESDLICLQDDKSGQLSQGRSDGAEFIWRSASSEEYIIHSDEGTDYLSNSDNWYVCSPDDRTEGDHYLSTGEYPPPPATADPNTCVGALNILASDGMFERVLGYSGEILFRESEGQEAFTCSSESKAISQENFWSDTGCLKYCYADNDAVKLLDVLSDSQLTSTFVDEACMLIYSEQVCNNYVATLDEFISTSTLCDGDTCLPISYSSNTPCEDFNLIDNSFYGESCDLSKEFCTTGTYVRSNGDLISNPASNSICCVTSDATYQGNFCETKPSINTQIDEEICKELSGDWITEPEENLDSFYCLSPSGNNSRCCLGGTWEVTYAQSREAIDNSEQFLCTASFGQENRFVECCGDIGNDDSCYNSRDEAYKIGSADAGTYVTPGASNYLILDWNSYDDATGALIDDKNKQILKRGSPANFDLSAAQERNRLDWRGFESVEMDVFYNVNEFGSIKFYNGATFLFSADFDRVITNGDAAGTYHHLKIPLAGISSSLLSQVTRITVDTTNDASSMYLALDRIYLTKGDGTDYYCAGNVGQWVNNLDGPNDNTGFLDLGSALGSEPYKDACDASNSFGWTGNLCCGDDSQAGEPEYYADTQAGCFEGKKISENTVVSSALKDSSYDDLLFFNKAFYQCSPDKESLKYTTIGIDYGGITGNLLIPTEQILTPGDSVGDYECTLDEVGRAYWDYSLGLACERRGYDYLFLNETADPSQAYMNPYLYSIGEYDLSPEARCCGEVSPIAIPDGEGIGFTNGDRECFQTSSDPEEYSWEISLNGLGKTIITKMLASKMYEIISIDDSYALHCDDITQVSPEGIASVPTEFDDSSVDIFCAARTGEEEMTKTLVGFSISGDSSTQEFLANYASYLSFVNVIDNTPGAIDAFTHACDTTTAATDDFFVLCQPQDTTKDGSLIHIALNENYHLLLISQVSDINDFNGFFDEGQTEVRTYVQQLIYEFLNIFTNWFTTEKAAPDQRLPSLLGEASDKNLDILQLVIQGEQNTGVKKELTGYIENIDSTGEEWVIAEFTNLYTDVLPLTSRYFGGVNNLNYQKGENLQLVQFPVDQARDTVDDFDWRYFTAALRLDLNYDVGNPITATLNDGVIDLGEDCDYAGSEILFRDVTADGVNNPSTTCGEWDPRNYSSRNSTHEVSCNSGEIDYTNCNYCGDGRTLNGEECDDGNRINSDLCSNDCIAAQCGDGILQVRAGEECDDGNLNSGDGCTEACKTEIIWFYDGDADGYGNTSVTLTQIDQPEGYVALGNDCNDGNPEINPGATELCDGVDNNCNSNIDEQFDLNNYYIDADGDGFGSENHPVSCSTSEAIVDNSDDCDDTKFNAENNCCEPLSSTAITCSDLSIYYCAGFGCTPSYSIYGNFFCSGTLNIDNCNNYPADGTCLTTICQVVDY
ncbi:MAG: DUF4215 domain-containing protein [Nanoarchaeota archaeon]|nr:DUF4215 domain-containing protein [Nanoarchaeota archaeon]